MRNTPFVILGLWLLLVGIMYFIKYSSENSSHFPQQSGVVFNINSNTKNAGITKDEANIGKLQPPVTVLAINQELNRDHERTVRNRLEKHFRSLNLSDCIKDDVSCDDVNCSFSLTSNCATKGDSNGSLSYLLGTLANEITGEGRFDNDTGAWLVFITLTGMY